MALLSVNATISPQRYTTRTLLALSRQEYIFSLGQLLCTSALLCRCVICWPCQSGKMSWMHGNHSMESLKNMHAQILHNVEMVQDRSSKILQEQERDLLRAFRARLFDVQVNAGTEQCAGEGKVTNCYRTVTPNLMCVGDWMKFTYDSGQNCCEVNPF